MRTPTRLVAAIVIAFGALGAHAATFLQYAMQPGYIAGVSGQGTITPAISTFTAIKQGETISVFVQPATWILEFSPVTGQHLGVGTYEDARWGIGGPNPGLMVDADGGCSSDYGRFTVLDLAIDASNNVTRLAVDFESHCGGLEAMLAGGIRIDSDVAYVPPVLTYAGPGFIQWAQQGLFVAQTDGGTVTRADGYFSASLIGSAVRLSLQNYVGAPPFLWDVEFSAPNGQVLAPGIYENAKAYPLNPPGTPGIYVSHTSSACVDATGRFVLYEMELAPVGVKKLAVDFELHCGGDPAGLFGGVRLNSSVPYSPPLLHGIVDHLVAVDPPATTLALLGVNVSGNSRVRTMDQDFHPYPRAPVHFSVPDGCGTLYSTDYNSDADAIAYLPTFVGNRSGPCAVVATLGLDTITFNYLVYTGSDLTLTPLPSSTLYPTAGQPFQVGLNMTLHGIPMVNEFVAFFVHGTPGGASASIPDYTRADSSGTASVTAVANGTGGNYTISAIVDGVTQTFSVVQLPQGTSAQRIGAPSPSGLGSINASLFTTQSSCAFVQSQFLAASALPAASTPPHEYVFPFGLMSFRADNCGAGQGVDFVIDYPQPLPPTAVFWRFGPTPDNRAAHWYPMTDATFSGTQVHFHVVDGGLGDDDLTANGSIAALGGVMTAGGVWQDMWWSGPAENGWGMSVFQHRDTLFAVIYAYDATGNPTWYVMPGGAWNPDQTVYSGSLYTPTGTPFFSYDASRLSVGAAVGTIALTFTGSNSGALDYTINGVTGHKSIQRQEFGVPDGTHTGTLGDMWWGGTSQNGWGIAVLHQYNTLFPVWFTYDASGKATWYVMPGGTWTSTDTYEGRVYRTTGSPWAGAQYDPTRLQVFDVGTYRIRFTGDNASFGYTVDGHSGTIPLVRESF